MLSVTSVVWRIYTKDLAKVYVQQAVDIDYSITENTGMDRQSAPEFDLIRSSAMTVCYQLRWTDIKILVWYY